MHSFYYVYFYRLDLLDDDGVKLAIYVVFMSLSFTFNIANIIFCEYFVFVITLNDSKTNNKNM
jgi:hypothetical protein